MDRTLLKRAVADSEDPTPVYIYREMAQWTMEDYNTQMKLIDALFDKLKPYTSVHVLYKVLRIIKELCETGHSDFQKEIQKNEHMEVIKTFTTYRGRPDARHGDGFNERVRQTARDAIKAAYANRKDDRLTIESGYGNNDTSGEATVVQSAFTTGAPMGGATGVYSSNIAPMPMTNKWAEMMAQQVTSANNSTTSSVFLSLAEKAKNGLALLYGPAMNSVGYKSSKDQLYESAVKLSVSGTSMTTPSQTHACDFQTVQLGVSSHPPPTTTTISPSNPLRGESNNSGFNFIDEIEKEEDRYAAPCNGSNDKFPSQRHEKLTPFQVCVQRLCQMKSTPQRVELHGFVMQCCKLGTEIMQERGLHDGENGLDECWEELAETLDLQLDQKHPWQRRLNALAALEALLHPQCDDADVAATMSQGVRRYFLENPEDVQRNIFVVQTTLRDRARRVVKLLGLPEHDDVSSRYPVPSDADISSISPYGKAEQLQSAGNAMQSLSWPAPISTVKVTETKGEGECHRMASMDGMSLHPSYRRDVRKKKTTLKKRAPMSFNGGLLQENMHGNYNDLICEGGMNPTRSCGKETSSLGFLMANATTGTTNGYDTKAAERNNVLDDVFGESSGEKSLPSTSSSAPNATTATTAIATNNNNGGGAVGSQPRNLSAFNFLTADKTNGIERDPPMPPPLLSSLQAQQKDVSEERNLPPLFGTANPFSSSVDEFKMDQGNPNSMVSESSLNTSYLSALHTPATNNSLSSMVVEMQHRLQRLMSEAQRDPSPGSMAQLQDLMLQQQRLMSLLSQQQQQQQQPKQQAIWGTSSSGVAFSSNIEPTSHHTHFAMSASPSFSPSTTKSNSFAQIQQEMMAQMLTSNPPQ